MQEWCVFGAVAPGAEVVLARFVGSNGYKTWQEAVAYCEERELEPSLTTVGKYPPSLVVVSGYDDAPVFRVFA